MAVKPAQDFQGNVPQESQLLVGFSGISTDRFVRNLVQLVRREIRRIRDRPQPRDERCLDIPDRRPIHPIEERMFLELLHAQTAVRRSDQPRVFSLCFSIFAENEEKRNQGNGGEEENGGEGHQPEI